MNSKKSQGSRILNHIKKEICNIHKSQPKLTHQEITTIINESYKTKLTIERSTITKIL